MVLRAALCSLTSFQSIASHLHIFTVPLEAEELASEFLAGDRRRSRSHEGIEYKIAFVRTHRNEPLDELQRFFCRVSCLFVFDWVGIEIHHLLLRKKVEGLGSSLRDRKTQLKSVPPTVLEETRDLNRLGDRQLCLEDEAALLGLADVIPVVFLGSEHVQRSAGFQDAIALTNDLKH